MSERDELDDIHTQLLSGIRGQEDYLYSRVSVIHAYSEGAEHALDIVRRGDYLQRALAEAWEKGKAAGLDGGWDNPYEPEL